jgi:hypothetical protein
MKTTELEFLDDLDVIYDDEKVSLKQEINSLIIQVGHLTQCISLHNLTISNMSKTLKFHEEAIVDLNYVLASIVKSSQSSGGVDMQLPKIKPKTNKSN